MEGMMAPRGDGNSYYRTAFDACQVNHRESSILSSNEGGGGDVMAGPTKAQKEYLDVRRRLGEHERKHPAVRKPLPKRWG